MKKKNNVPVMELMGIFSALGTLGLLALISWKAGVFRMVINELKLLISGEFQEISKNHTSFVMMFLVIFVVVILNIIYSFCLLTLISKILGKSGKHTASETLKERGSKYLFFSFFAEASAEELVARWFFLRLLTKITFLSGTVAFYVLFLIGNSLWALIHLSNYKKREDRKILRVLPQFIGGIFYTYIFLKYGLLATVLEHVVFNIILLSTYLVLPKLKIRVL
ncbi:hypothetical protein COW91_00220 [Candidatus Nomurabacteria bacterium CG22_combo_CG10-13_8_21_14_all_32_8]|uniref:CAAX prenyl protease 2/Lysostaphin resistance protein A-like domain-containing protein n=1 Tax=Candidatus Nomurabacteria bacterium CG22_combo_CG10-13_8_21_14_all_32_8 TaxID=1974732 RepID=A0A2H0CHD4_9BACT|nr:MAG: hypothetical protein COW91_00220 [Candidatus Nomurabacteria bacterium CG22_combo_CG10-13_8_21_14_all_32_8]